MLDNKLKEIADNADLIIAGYSFTKGDNGFIRILNLKNPKQACLLQNDGVMLETTMDDITLLKVQSYYLKNREFLEEIDA